LHLRWVQLDLIFADRDVGSASKRALRGTVVRLPLYRLSKPCRLGVATGAGLGIAAQVFLVWVIIGHIMPFFGLELLDVAQSVADFNLPARLGQLFGVSL
jgi:hypothetical protein